MTFLVAFPIDTQLFPNSEQEASFMETKKECHVTKIMEDNQLEINTSDWRSLNLSIRKAGVINKVRNVKKGLFYTDDNIYKTDLDSDLIFSCT